MQHPIQRITQRDIARAVGVSQTIVSDVLCERPRGRVSAETRARILEAAERLGYRPNTSARALRMQRSLQVAYLTTQSEVHDFGALEEKAIGGLAKELSRHDYRLVLEVVETTEALPLRLHDLFASGACDGVVVRAHAGQAALWDSLKAVGRPLVVIGQCPEPELSSVAHDVPGLISDSLRRLAAQGHRTAGLITGARPGDYYRLCVEAWQREATSLGLVAEQWISNAANRAEGEQTMREWLSQADGPTGIVSLSVRPALGTVDALTQVGRRFGAGVDLIVIGSAQHAWLFGTGVWYCGLDLVTVGARSAEVLLAQIEGQDASRPVRLRPPITQL